MATLQSIRSKGPLLIIVIGLALFAFIAGDAWKVMQPHQSQDVGEINGKTLSAQDYQEMVEEYSEVIKMSNSLTSLSEAQTDQIKDEVWMSYVNNTLVGQEAEKLGLTVTKQEIQNLIDEGAHPMLRNSPFVNSQTGAFDQDMLKKVLADYARMSKENTSNQYFEYVAAMTKFWSFLERRLVEMRLTEKYQSLIAQAISSNSVEAQATFDNRVNQTNLMLAAIPYTSIPDSTIKVKVSEVKDLYNKQKEQYRQFAETRSIKYIDVHVTASAEDRAQLQDEVTGYAQQLKDEISSDYTSFIRGTGSEYPYVDLFYTKQAFPTDIVARLDSVSIGEVYGPYYNAADNTLNAFKKIAKVTAADSIEYRQIQVYDQDITKTRELADSIYNAIKGGAKFADLAEKYGQPGTSNWISSANYENAPLDNDNLKYVSAITGLGVNEIANVQIGVANVILQVTNKKVMKDKYKVAVIKRTVNFSQDTYNRAYNDFSQFIAANNTVSDLTKNAEDAGYTLLDIKDLNSSSHGIAGIQGTKEALRWAFSAKPGEVSGLYESGNNDRLLVVGLDKIIKEGYRPMEEVQNELRNQVVKDKKAEMIMADIRSGNISSFDQYRSMDKALTDSVKFVSFNVPAFVSVLSSSEPVVGAYASVTPTGTLSAPFKGNAGVIAVQPYAKEKTNDEFNAEEEKLGLEASYERVASNGYIRSLYRKANVKDNRYLFF